MSTSQIASDEKIASALARLGATALPSDDSLVLKMALVALGNITTGGGGASNALLLAGPSAATLDSLTAATAATGGLFYGTQSAADRKFTLTAAGAALTEAADAASQRTALACPGLAVANVFTVNGAVSAPAFSLTGIPFTGGTATTTKPLFLLEPSGTTSTGWSTSGTMFGVNAPSGFTGNVFDFQITGLSGIRGFINSAGNSTIYLGQRGAYISTVADYYLSIQNYFGNVVTQDSSGTTSLGVSGAVSVGNATIGFYGVTPIARAVLATGAGATVDNVITALQNLGLVKQS